MAQGRVQRVFPDKGYGFIRPDEGGEDLFVHFRDVRMPRSLEPGQVVSYSVAAGRDGRRRATRVTEPVVIFDPAALTPAERDTAERMLDLLDDPDKFDEAVLEYVRRPTERMQRVLQSTDLAEPVLHALHRLAARAEVALAAAKRAGDRDAELGLVSDQRLLGMERTRLKPLVHLAYGDAAAQGMRQRALRILGKVYYSQLREIMHDLGTGMDEDEAKGLAAKRAKATG